MRGRKKKMGEKSDRGEGNGDRIEGIRRKCEGEAEKRRLREKEKEKKIDGERKERQKMMRNKRRGAEEDDKREG